MFSIHKKHDGKNEKKVVTEVSPAKKTRQVTQIMEIDKEYVDYVREQREEYWRNEERKKGSKPATS